MLGFLTDGTDLYTDLSLMIYSYWNFSTFAMRTQPFDRSKADKKGIYNTLRFLAAIWGRYAYLPAVTFKNGAYFMDGKNMSC